MKNKNYYVPLMLIFCLFFLWAISSNLLPTMIRQLMKTCELNAFEASFTETAYWLAYFICPIPIAMFMKNYSYKSGIIFGLLLAACGGLLFFPAAMLKEYWAYLCIFFIIATGMCFLETAANPYVTALGDPKSAPRRLNLAQSFNGLGAFIAAMFLSKLILSGNHYTRDTLPTSFPGGWEGYIQTETDAMKLPYLLLAMLLIVIAIIFIFSKLPKIKEGNTMEGVEYKGEKLIDFGVLKRSHLRWGVIAQFFYNGGQTAINSLFLVYCCTYAELPENTATTFFGLYMLAFLAGTMDRHTTHGKIPSTRHAAGICFDEYPFMWCCDLLWRKDRTVCHARHLFLYVYHVSYTVLAGSERTWQSTKSGSAFLVMAIVGNACLPQLTAYYDALNEHIYYIAYSIPMICFLFCAYYGWKGYKVID